MENFRLKVFRTVATHLNFSRAAEELLLTQPAVTQQIKALEDEFGVPLFDRTGGRITLTPAGQALLPYAEKLKALSEEARSTVANVSGKPGGQLALGASQTISHYVLPNMIAGFLRQNPRLAITVISGNTDAVLDATAAQPMQPLCLFPLWPSAIEARPRFRRPRLFLYIPAVPIGRCVSSG